MTFVLSFEKQRGGCSGEALQQQLYDSISTFPLPLGRLATIVMDSAANMNHYRDYDGLLSFSSSIFIIFTVLIIFFIWTPQNILLLSLPKIWRRLSHSWQAVWCSEEGQSLEKPVKLLTDVETWWWSTHVTIERGLHLRDLHWRLCFAFKGLLNNKVVRLYLLS